MLPQHQQQLLLAQQNLTSSSPTDESRRLRMLLNNRNMSIGKDGLSNSVGDVVPNVGSPLQAGCPVLSRGDTDMLIKVIIWVYHFISVVYLLFFLSNFPLILVSVILPQAVHFITCFTDEISIICSLKWLNYNINNNNSSSSNNKTVINHSSSSFSSIHSQASNLRVQIITCISKIKWGELAASLWMVACQIHFEAMIRSVPCGILCFFFFFFDE